MSPKKENKRAKRFIKFYEKQKELHKAIREDAADIISSANFRKSDECIQHGTMSVKNHSMNVAKYSLAISKKLPVRFNRKELVRGALLHDYFLYDWHDKDHVQLHKLHGFYHPGVALKNASKEYPLTPREKDIIGKHMWPLTVVPPMCREAWVVTAADKYCSLLETIRLHKGHRIRKTKKEPGFIRRILKHGVAV